MIRSDRSNVVFSVLLSFLFSGSSGDELENRSTASANHNQSASGLEISTCEARDNKETSRNYTKDMCITSSHLRAAEEEDQDLIGDEEEDEELEDEEREEEIHGDSEASDSESRTIRRHDRLQVRI